MKRHLNRMKRASIKDSIAMFDAVLVGRPNVGKSAIWNRIVKKNDAIVSPIAGTTRDRKEGKAVLGELEFKIVDTGGLEDATGEISRAAQLQTKFAVEETNAIIFCVDAKMGITIDDEHYARYLRTLMTKKHHTVLVANKTEGRLSTLPGWPMFIQDCRRLGFGEPVCFSAAHGEGMADLHNALLPIAKLAKIEANNSAKEESASHQEKELDLKLTILGRPNAGKSTLLNTITQSSRVIVGPTPGLTRDSIEVSWDYQGRTVRLVDTAGWRSNQKSALYAATKESQKMQSSSSDSELDENIKRDNALLEGMSVNKAFKALAQTHVAVLVVDVAGMGMSSNKTPCIASQDLAIAGRILEEGKPLILVVNKMDLVKVTVDPKKKKKNQQNSRKLSAEDEIEFNQKNPSAKPMDHQDLLEMKHWVEEQFSQSIPQSQGCPVICISALKPGASTVDEIMSAVVQADAKWKSRISTPKLNRWLQEVMDKNPPSSVKNVTFGAVKKTKHAHRGFKAMAPIPVKLKYMTQVSTRPPTFAVFVNKNNPLHAFDEAYKRFLINRLKESFDLHGIPLRILVRSSGNPFLNKSRGVRRPRARPAAAPGKKEEEEEKGGGVI